MRYDINTLVDNIISDTKTTKREKLLELNDLDKEVCKELDQYQSLKNKIRGHMTDYYE